MRETCGLNPSAIPLHAHIDDVTRDRSSLSMPTGFIPGYRRVRILLILIYIPCYIRFHGKTIVDSSYKTLLCEKYELESGVV